jgi:hypothetical protein
VRCVLCVIECALHVMGKCACILVVIGNTISSFFMEMTI